MNWTTSLFLALLLGTGFSPGLMAAEDRVPGQVIVQLLRPEGLRPSGADDDRTLRRLNLRRLRVLSQGLGIYLLGYDPAVETAEAVLDRLRDDPSVAAVQFNYRVRPRNEAVIPNDPDFDRQWGLRPIQAPESWGLIGTGGQTARGDDIVVAILDSGYEPDHDELRENIWINRGEVPNDGIDNDLNGYVDDISGWNFIDDSPIHGPDFHGTAVSGIIGAQGDNRLGVTGINWSVQMMLFDIQFVDEVVAAYAYVVDQRRLYNQSKGARGAFVVVTNASIGIDRVFCSEQPIWGAMYEQLGQVGVLTAAGPGNTDYNVDEAGDMPTTCPSDFLIATLNTNRSDEKHRSSAWGPIHIDIGSPGQGSYTTDLDNGYRTFNGNSAAVPHLAGAIALLYSLPCSFLAEDALNQPAQTALLVRRAILDGVDPRPALKPFTASSGRLNLLNSIRVLDDGCVIESGPLEILNLYPNPAGRRVQVEYQTPDLEPYTFEVFNAMGQRVYRQEVIPSALPTKKLFLEVNNWASGLYVLRMSRGKAVETRTFLVAGF